MDGQSSLVHTEESTPHPPPLPSYRDNLAIKAGDDFLTAEKLYEAVAQTGNSKPLEQFRSCRTNAWFVRHVETGIVKVVANACRLRWCPFCSNAKRWLVTKNVEQYLINHIDKRFLTLTVKHTDEPLENQIEKLYAHFRNLRRTVDWLYHVEGGVWFFQIKKTESTGQWHPHLHVLVSGRYWARQSLSALWHKVTGDSMVTDVRAIRDNRKAAEYVARYCSKPAVTADMTTEELLSMYHALLGRRLSGTFGNAKEIKLTTKVTTEHKKFVKLTTWYSVIDGMKDNTEYRDIYNAYVNRTPLKYVPECEYLNQDDNYQTGLSPPEDHQIQNWLF